LDNVDLLDIMFKDTAATGNLAWTPSSGVLPADFETPTEGDEEVETHDLTQPPNSTQTTQDKGKKRASTSSIHGKRKKGGGALMLTHQLSRICDVELRNSASSLEPGSSIRDVMERVCTLDGVEKGSNLYLMAALIFQK
jgi:hypothetical protein